MRVFLGKCKAFFEKDSVLPITLCVLFLALMIATVFSVQSVPKKAEKPEASRTLYAVISDPGADETLFYSGGTPLGSAEGLPQKQSVAFGGTTQVVLTEKGELVLLTDGKCTPLFSGVTDFKLASEGGALVFVQEMGLWHFTLGEEAPVLIQDFYFDNLNQLVLSPTGKSLFYLDFPPPGGGSISPRYWKSETGEVQDIQALVPHADAVLLGVSDSGEHLYYLTADSTALYHTAIGGQAEKLTASFSAEDGGVRFNRDLTEVIFCEQNGYTYFSQGGGEKEKVSSGAATPVLLHREAVFDTGVSLIHSSDSFTERLYLVTRESAQTLRYLSADFSSAKYAADVQEAFLSRDGKTLFFVRKSEERARIYQMDLSEEKPTESLVASGVTAYAFNAAGDQVYYITRGNKLYLRTDGNSTLLFEGAQDVFVSPNDEVFWTVMTSVDRFVLYRAAEQGGQRLFTDASAYFCTENATYVRAAFDGVEHWYIVDGAALISLAHP